MAVTIIRPSEETGHLSSGRVGNGQWFAETPVHEATGADADTIIVPATSIKMIESISLHLVISGTATGRVQVTNDPIADVEAETADWADWDINGIGVSGDVSASVMVEFAPSVTAFRINATTASAGNSLQLKARFNLM